MVNYKYGKVYKLTSEQTDKIYVGSTALKYLSQRLQKHKEMYAAFSKDQKHIKFYSYKLFELGDVKIELIEKFPCDAKTQLVEREEYWRIQLSELCVNHNKAHIAVDKKTYKHDWYVENQDRIHAKQKKERQEHPEINKTRCKNYYQKHKKEHKAYNGKIIKCECGMTYTQSHKNRHLESAKHKKLLSEPDVRQGRGHHST